MDQPARPTPDLISEAHKRALRYAPPPQWRPVYGGLAGAAAFCVPMLFFATSVEVSVYALIMNAVVGFALPFVYLKRKQDAYDRAWERELTALKGRSEP